MGEERTSDGGVVRARAQRSRCDRSPFDHSNSNHNFINYRGLNHNNSNYDRNLYGCLNDSNAPDYNFGLNHHGRIHHYFCEYVARTARANSARVSTEHVLLIDTTDRAAAATSRSSDH